MRVQLMSLFAALTLHAACADEGDTQPSGDEDEKVGERASDDRDEDDSDEEDEDPETPRAGDSSSDGGRGQPDSARPAASKRDSGSTSESGSGNASDSDEAEVNDGDSDTEESPTGSDGPTPMLPKPTMECPVFTSGTNTIMGLSVEVWMGPKTDKKGPLLFYWHGTGGRGSDAQRLPAQIRDEVLSQGGMIVSPTTTTMTGTDVTFFLMVWYAPGDLEFADLVTACAVQNMNIDPRRIYATGCSAGGLMTGVMAYQRSSYLAAATPNSGGIVGVIPGLSTLQDPDHVPAVMTMHGGRGEGKDMVVVEFADTSQELVKGLASKGGFAVNCDHQGGHCAAPPDLQIAAWQFMKDHPFGVSPEPYANGLPDSFPDYCTIVK